MSVTDRNRFGAFLRAQREALPGAPSLRSFASTVGLTPARLSRIERGLDDPPDFERIEILASALQQSPDVLLAVAGRVAPDISDIISSRPNLFAEFASVLRNSPEEAILRVVREVRDGNW